MLVPVRWRLFKMDFGMQTIVFRFPSQIILDPNAEDVRIGAASSAGFCQLPWNPLSAILISTSICVRWTMIGHHVCHGGYNAQVRALGLRDGQEIEMKLLTGEPGNYTSKRDHDGSLGH